jgi:hypothetical protein
LVANIEDALAVHAHSYDSDPRLRRFLRELADVELGDLNCRMHASFPPAEDDTQERDHSHAVTPRDELAQWRSGVIGELEARGTVAACEVIALLASTHPDSDGLTWRLSTSLTNVLEATWQPPNSIEILALFRQTDRRSVQGAADLVAVIVESLDRYQAELQGHTPSAFQLWNEWPVKGKDGTKSTQY